MDAKKLPEYNNIVYVLMFGKSAKDPEQTAFAKMTSCIRWI